MGLVESHLCPEKSFWTSYCTQKYGVNPFCLSAYSSFLPLPITTTITATHTTVLCYVYMALLACSKNSLIKGVLLYGRSSRREFLAVAGFCASAKGPFCLVKKGPFRVERKGKGRKKSLFWSFHGRAVSVHCCSIAGRKKRHNKYTFLVSPFPLQKKFYVLIFQMLIHIQTAFLDLNVLHVAICKGFIWM